MHATSAHSSPVFGHPFQKIAASEYIVETWFERDRAHFRLETPGGRMVFELWNDAVFEAIEDGFLTAPRRPRPTSADWQPAAVQYAIDQGLITL